MKPSELILVLQKAVDAGLDDTTHIYFDTEGREFDCHMAQVGSAYFDLDAIKAVGLGPFVSLHEKRLATTDEG